MRYRLLIEYEGTAFHGWQVQAREATIQAALEKALTTALRHPTSLIGSGRTDAGVHAKGQVAHFDTRQACDIRRVQAALNGLLPPTIQVLEMLPASESFHARFDARERRYHYYVSTVPRVLERQFRLFLRPAPDFAQMNEAAAYLLGTHNCSAFCRTRSETTNRVCTIREARWVAEARPDDWYFMIRADRFLHGMVRAIVGTLLEVGRGKRLPEDIVRIRATQDRREAGPAAPPKGLVLEEVRYTD